MINNYYQLFTSLNSPTFASTRLAFAHVEFNILLLLTYCLLVVFVLCLLPTV